MRQLVSVVTWVITWFKLQSKPGSRRVSASALIKGDVSIGDYTYIGGRTEIRGKLSSVRIGRYCSIGRDVKIFSTGQMHVFGGLSTYPFFTIDQSLERQRFNVPCRATVIGNDVWIGSNAIVLAGVEIGDGAAVGAGAVVTKDVAPFAIVAGCPARPIGARFNEMTAQKVAASRWWELDYPDLKIKYPKLVAENLPITRDHEF